MAEFLVDYANHYELVTAYNGMGFVLNLPLVSTKSHTQDELMDMVENLMSELSNVGELEISSKGQVKFTPNADADLASIKRSAEEGSGEPELDEPEPVAPPAPAEPVPLENEEGMAAKARALHDQRMSRKGRPGKRGGGGGNVKYKDGQKIRVLVTDPKKTGGALERFKLMKDGMLVAQFLQLGGTSRRDIRRAARKGYIKLEG